MLGYTVIKDPKQELDVKFDIHYERQTYFVTPNVMPPPPLTPSKNLIGADFGDTYMLKLPHGLVFNQTAVITPAFNNTNAYSALATAGLYVPVYKRFGFTRRNTGRLPERPRHREARRIHSSSLPG